MLKHLMTIILCIVLTGFYGVSAAASDKELSLTAFSYSPSISEEVKKIFFQEISEDEDASLLIAVFQDFNIYSVFEEDLKRLNENPYDLAVANAVAFSVNLSILRETELSDQQDAGIFKYYREHFQTKESTNKNGLLDDRSLQIFTEIIYWETLWISIYKTKVDEGKEGYTKEKLHKKVKSFFESKNIDVSTLVLTEDGQILFDQSTQPSLNNVSKSSVSPTEIQFKPQTEINPSPERRAMTPIQWTLDSDKIAGVMCGYEAGYKSMGCYL